MQLLAEIPLNHVEWLGYKVQLINDSRRGSFIVKVNPDAGGAALSPASTQENAVTLDRIGCLLCWDVSILVYQRGAANGMSNP